MPQRTTTRVEPARSLGTSANPLSLALCRALRPSRAVLGAGIVGAGLATAAQLAGAEPFPPLLPFPSLDGSTGFALHGIDAEERSGYSVSGAGDLNGDGLDDFVIGSQFAEIGGRDDVGRAYVVFGRTTGFPARFPLASLRAGDGSKGFTVRGVGTDDHAGTVSDAGDINGDGIGDVFVSAQFAGPSGVQTGEGYVIFGRSTGFPATFDLLSLQTGDGSAGFVIRAAPGSEGSLLGRTIGAAGDVNGDGFDDLVIGAQHASRPPDRLWVGEAYVVFGTTQPFPAQFQLASLFEAQGGDGSRGFVLRGVAERNYTGSAVDCAGDVNGDGIDDLLIGASGFGNDLRFHIGAVYVVFGRTGGFLPTFELSGLLGIGGGDGSEGFVAKGAYQSDAAGVAAARTGDVNADGIDDLLIGAPLGDPDGRVNAGKSYVVYGRSSGFPAELRLNSLEPDGGGDGSAGFVLYGAHNYGMSGEAVSGAGDVNSDGIDDLIIGAGDSFSNGHPGAGVSYLVFGRATGFPPAFQLASLDPAAGGDGSKGFLMPGTSTYDDAGRSVRNAGDVNGDGIADVIIGADGVRRLGRDNVGATYVVFGRTAAR